MSSAGKVAIGTVLVVEPSEELCEITSFFLQQAGFEVKTASNAARAIELLADESIDLVVADMHTPGVGGMGLLEKIKSQSKIRPTVILTGDSVEDAIDDVFGHGAEAVFAKPVHFGALSELAVNSVAPRDVSEKRRPYRIPVNMEILVGEASKRCSMTVGNIHQNGVFIAWGADPLPAVGDSLEFCLPLLKNGFGNVVGRMSVRWTREKADERGPRGVGVQIDNMAPIHASYLARIVNAIKTGVLHF